MLVCMVQHVDCTWNCQPHISTCSIDLEQSQHIVATQDCFVHAQVKPGDLELPTVNNKL